MERNRIYAFTCLQGRLIIFIAKISALYVSVAVRYQTLHLIGKFGQQTLTEAVLTGVLHCKVLKGTLLLCVG